MELGKTKSVHIVGVLGKKGSLVARHGNNFSPYLAEGRDEECDNPEESWSNVAKLYRELSKS